MSPQKSIVLQLDNTLSRLFTDLILIRFGFMSPKTHGQARLQCTFEMYPSFPFFVLICKNYILNSTKSCITPF
jgi:hypothetical protein